MADWGIIPAPGGGGNVGNGGSPIILFPKMATVLSGGQFLWYNTGTVYPKGGLWYKDAPAAGHQYQLTFFSEAGVYDIIRHGLIYTSGGNFQIDIDGVNVGSISAYSASTDYDAMVKLPSVNIGSGKHIMKITIGAGAGGFYNDFWHEYIIERIS